MKKILALLLAVLMVFTLCACGGNSEGDLASDGGNVAEAPKGEKLNMVVEAKGMEEGAVYSADIYYEPIETVEISSSYENRQEIKDKTQNIEVEFRLCSDSTYGNNKKSDSAKEGYKEFKVGDFDAYAYHYSNSCQKVYVFLDGSAEAAAQARYMAITVAPYEKLGDTTGEMVLEMEYVKNIINSITYNGLITPDTAGE